LEVTGIVVTVKVAVVAPATTVTEAGTWAAELFEDRPTTAPPAGAGPDNAMVPVEELPPTTEVGTRLMELKAGTTAGAVTVRVAVRLTLS